MGNVSKHFFICLFSSFLLTIVLINYVGWSGAYINLTTGSDINWTNSYFGFQSISAMGIALDRLFTESPFNIKDFIKLLNEIGQTITFNIPNLITKIINSDVGLLDIVKVVVDIFAQPILLTVRLLISLCYVIQFALNLIIVLLMAFSGSFNIPMDNVVPMPIISESLRFCIPVLVL